ncbi:MarR family winged helix-turn-helix transcriptional regulator [Acetobacter nitrogenifigens]|uniref:MarR family winged helix-turn-helix transcriptional regulator n=1 Tax=Acetobacter nitrogenifigens TaxID=285268 RepID=UPI00040B458B|nr:MarR family winged helix-turn-helix transcriptional regulator [Acetobacter nitrogenifigens]
MNHQEISVAPKVRPTRAEGVALVAKYEKEGLTQVQMAERLAVSKGTIANWAILARKLDGAVASQTQTERKQDAVRQIIALMDAGRSLAEIRSEMGVVQSTFATWFAQAKAKVAARAADADGPARVLPPAAQTRPPLGVGDPVSYGAIWRGLKFRPQAINGTADV